MTILYAVSAVCSIAGLFFIIYGAFRGDLGFGIFLGFLFVGIPWLIILLKKRRQKKAARKREEERERQEKAQQEAARAAEARRQEAYRAHAEAVKAREMTFEQLCAVAPKSYICHFYRKSPRFEAWVNTLHKGMPLFAYYDNRVHGYVFDDEIVVPYAISQLMDQYPDSQIFVLYITEAPSGTSVDLIYNPIRV